jgi:hypothetical protein
MIDLSYTRAALLAEIEAPDPARLPLREITDPASQPGTHGYACAATDGTIYSRSSRWRFRNGSRACRGLN